MSHVTAENGNKMGNYHGYYKMRPDAIRRIALLDKYWFKDLSCIDIGCNDGQFCMSLAEVFQPALLLGIDPDHVLVDSAKSRVKRAIHADKAQQNQGVQTVVLNKTTTQNKASIAFRPRSVAITTVVHEGSKATGSHTALSDPTKSTFPYNVKFKVMDVFDYSCAVTPTTEGKYDVVTCFSVTKWVHLNGGDARLVDLFCRLYGLVRRGGRVIIEYQPWKSYENNKNVNEAAKLHFPLIRCKPEMFEWILTELVGFEIEARRGPSVEQAKGFDRPILVLRRPVEVGPGCRWCSEKDVQRLVALAVEHSDNAVVTRTTPLNQVEDSVAPSSATGTGTEHVQTTSGSSKPEGTPASCADGEGAQARHQKKRKCGHEETESSEARRRKHKA